MAVLIKKDKPSNSNVPTLDSEHPIRFSADFPLSNLQAIKAEMKKNGYKTTRIIKKVEMFFEKEFAGETQPELQAFVLEISRKFIDGNIVNIDFNKV